MSGGEEIGAEDWVLGADGVYVGRPGGAWRRLPEFLYHVNAILRLPGKVVAATHGGLWALRSGHAGRWVQLHDETLTEVLTIAPDRGEIGLAAGSPYGVSKGRLDEAGFPRWTSVTEYLSVNDRYTNVLRVDPRDPSRWLAGTEGGVIAGEDFGASWRETELRNTAVRGICFALGRWWAGADAGGVFASEDGHRWRRAGSGLEETAVFSVAGVKDLILAGTEAGVAAGDGHGEWERRGPRVRVRSVVADGHDSSTWLAGADPGGLWTSHDDGHTWRNTAGIESVRAICVPERGK
jgi:hypothetical protein